MISSNTSIKTRYALDTNGLISHFSAVFDRPSTLSPKAHRIIEAGFSPDGNVLLSIPSIVFIEVFDKWYTNEEFVRKFVAEVFIPVKEADNIEIRPLDSEVLENLLKLDGMMLNHDLHDKIILASAMTLNCLLITSDGPIASYVQRTHVIPGVIT